MGKLIVFTNAKVYTMDPSLPRADSLAILNGEIIDVGLSLENKYGEAKIVDLNGDVILPGFIDTHIHLTSLALMKRWVSLKSVKSIYELKNILRKYSVKGYEWIIGRGFNEEQFDERVIPTRHDLDEAVPNKPVIIVRVCGHVGVANTLALKLLGYYDLVKKDEYLAQGILREELLSKALEKIPKPSFKEFKNLLHKVIKELLTSGLTAVCSVSATPDEYLALKEIPKNGVKVKLIPNIEYFDYFLRSDVSKSDVIGFKIFADGSFGGRTAALREPYSDKPESRGVLLADHNLIANNILKVSKYGFMLAVHAIGDKAIDEVIKAIKEVGSGESVRVEHCSLTPPDILHELEKFKPYAITVQPHFRISDWWLKGRLGKRVKWVYMFNTFLKKNFLIASSSDAPVEPYDPLLNIWASVTENAIGEYVSRNEALKMYTIYGAKVLKENNIGMLRKGFKANFIILSNDVYKVNVNEIKKIKIKTVIVEGKTVFKINSRQA